MNDTIEAGLEEHLYRNMVCCLHPCKVTDCPEIICAIDYPGGINAYQRDKQLYFIAQAATLPTAAEILGISPRRAVVRYRKFKDKVLA